MLQEYPFQTTLTMNAVEMLQKHDAATIAAKVASGKSIIAAKILVEQGSSVTFYFAPSWIQLMELYNGLKQVIGKEKIKIYRIGGNQDELKHLQELTSEGQFKSKQRVIVFSTIHTVLNPMRRTKFLRFLNHCDLVIHDETHMLSQGKRFKDLTKLCKKKGVKFLELTGTPVKGCSPIVKGALSLDELRKIGRICAAEMIEVPTNQDFNIIKFNETISESSYQDLAENHVRNKFIARFISKTKYKKSFVVCCNIEHTDILQREILKVIPNAQIGICHSMMTKSERLEILNAFRSSKITILLGVRSIFTGFSVPDADVMFNTRPTKSPREFEQALGRILRSDPSKKKAFYYDFTDNVSRFGELVYHPPYTTPASSSSSRLQFFGRYPRQQFKIDRTLGFTNYPLKVNKRFYSFPINNGVPFGVELEFTHRTKTDEIIESEKEFNKLFKSIVGVLSSKTSLPFKHFGYEDNDPEIDYEKYHSLVYDGSCLGEVVTKVLLGEQGLRDLDAISNTMKEMVTTHELHVNYKTGLHVHIGTKVKPGKELRTFLHNVRAIEPYLALLVSPSRICTIVEEGRYIKTMGNQYCHSWLKNVSYDEIESINTFNSLKEILSTKSFDSRYMTFNLDGVLYDDGPQTIECRLHNGTLEKEKIIPWVSLVSQLMETLKSEHSFTYSEKKKRMPFPTKKELLELPAILEEALNDQSDDLVELLVKRAEISFKNWQKSKFI